MRNREKLLDRQVAYDFNKTHTQIAKGIAILLMMYHHLFVLPQRIQCDYFSVLNLCGLDFQTILAYFCKICVGIFVFLSGYGLCNSAKKYDTILKMYKAIFIRTIKFFVNYWIVFIIFIPIGIFLKVYNFEGKYILMAMLGFEVGSYSTEWWFVNAYIILLFIFPLFYYIFSRIKTIKKIVIFSLYTIVFLSVKLCEYYLSGVPLVSLLISSYLKYIYDFQIISIFLVGILFSKFNLYSRFVIFIQSKVDIKIFSAVILVCVFVVRAIFSNSPSSMNIDFLLVPFFVFSITTLFYDTKISVVFRIFGKQSTNIWLSHTFWCYYFWQPIVFFPYFSTAIYIWFAILSLITSFAINLILIPINNLFFSKEHKLSHKGYFKME